MFFLSIIAGSTSCNLYQRQLPSPNKIFKALLSGKTLIFKNILRTTIRAVSIATIETLNKIYLYNCFE